MTFKLKSDFTPTGDQPQAIEKLYKGVLDQEPHQLLIGVTGSGKTFSMANIIQALNRPTLVLAHNKTLAAQLYSEFKTFFPENAVEYFVSYYDYYQPEAYIPTTGVYIEKDLSINEEIEKMRLRTTSSLLSGRRDVIVVASVSCLYGIGNPTEFRKNVVSLKKGDQLSIDVFLKRLVQSLYKRSEQELVNGGFRVRGDTIEVFPSYADTPFKIHFFGDEIEDIELVGANGTSTFYDTLDIYPASIFVTSPDIMTQAIEKIQDELHTQLIFLKDHGKHLEAKRLEERTVFDLEMIKEVGYCSGIENYSRFFDNREAGSRPFCLLDFFPQDYLMFVDESHVTIPQVRAMFGGDRSRKKTLVEYGFRLPSAMDNRPLTFEEFETMQNQVIYVSATPSEYEFENTEGVYVEQIIRPTGLLDPIIEVRPTTNQVDDLIEEVQKRIKKDERILVTTLTKKMAEELTKYLTKLNIRTQYIHSDVDTLERVKILEGLRKGYFDVLVGVNLLREGLDLPEVSLVGILDADKEGFLRSHRSLTQTIGRASRNVNGMAILYADKITQSMQKTIDETNYRREAQIKYNLEHNLEPKALNKKIDNSAFDYGTSEERGAMAAEDPAEYKSEKAIQKRIRELKKEMEQAAKALDFLKAAQLRDQIKILKHQE